MTEKGTMRKTDRDFLALLGFAFDPEGAKWWLEYRPSLTGDGQVRPAFCGTRYARLADCWLDGYSDWSMRIVVDDETMDVDVEVVHSGGKFASSVGGDDLACNLATGIIDLPTTGL